MAELKRMDEALPATEVASDGISSNPEGPMLVKSQEPKTPDGATTVSEPMPLFSKSEVGDFRSQWSNLRPVSWTNRAGRSKAPTSWSPL
jgi:hypothetical protein